MKFLEFQNPWWSGKPAKPTERFRRWAFAEVADRLERGLTSVVAVRGPRQVGKTTIQEQLIEELLKLRGVKPARIFRVQFDDVPSLGSYNQPILALVRWFEKNVLGGYTQRVSPKKASRFTSSSTRFRILRPGHRRSSPWWIMSRQER